jgi:hypothetical protein
MQNPEKDQEDPRCLSHRPEFLLEFYRQASVHLGRHVTGVWQCVGVVGAALAVFAIDKNNQLNDYVCALVVMLCGWLAASTLDASNWFNRNLALISNTERLFLTEQDLTLVHPYFKGHRDAGKQAEHFGIQLVLAGSVGTLVLVYHFIERVWPGFSLPLSYFQPARLLPYIVAPATLALVIWLACKFKGKDRVLKRNAPGYQPPRRLDQLE